MWREVHVVLCNTVKLKSRSLLFICCMDLAVALSCGISWTTFLKGTDNPALRASKSSFAVFDWVELIDYASLNKFTTTTINRSILYCSPTTFFRLHRNSTWSRFRSIADKVYWLARKTTWLLPKNDSKKTLQISQLHTT